MLRRVTLSCWLEREHENYQIVGTQKYHFDDAERGDESVAGSVRGIGKLVSRPGPRSRGSTVFDPESGRAGIAEVKRLGVGRGLIRDENR